MKSPLLYKEMMPEAYSLSLHHTNALFFLGTTNAVSSSGTAVPINMYKIQKSALGTLR